MLHLIKSNYCCCCFQGLSVTRSIFCDRSDHHTSLHSVSVDLLDGVDETCVSEGEVLVDSELPVFLNSVLHNFFKTRVDNVDFGSTLSRHLVFFEAHHLEELLLRLFLILLGHATGSDVIDVLKPFEVGAGDTTAVDEHVGGSDNASAHEDLLGGVGSGTVGSLEDGLNLNQFSVILVKRFFGGCRDHAVSLLEEE